MRHSVHYTYIALPCFFIHLAYVLLLHTAVTEYLNTNETLEEVHNVTPHCRCFHSVV